jgi:hypothetical protein
MRNPVSDLFLSMIDPACWIKIATIDDVKLWLALAGLTFEVIEET